MPVYVIDKPLGLTSHDVVAIARRSLSIQPVGHAGTLDPLAGGVLVLLVAEATKISSFLTGSDKEYLAWVSFGAGTETLDAEGPITATADASALTQATLEAALPPFLTMTAQLPPSYSAIKQGGVKGYQAARRGQALPLEPRPVGYRRIALLGFAATRDALPRAFSLTPAGDWRVNERGLRVTLPEALGGFPTALLLLTVQAGTYLRAFARDLGAAIGFPAHLSGLVRTRAGQLGLERAVPLDALPDAPAIAPADTLPYPVLRLTGEQAIHFRQGRPLSSNLLNLNERTTLLDPHGRLVAIAEPQKLLRVWH
ncbi:MAG: tRNA pseudouridine(55) synthase TruB [Truepera sp.]|nr:tRNA pseudouridine(55) synthase TruB [Truepera sp.]